MLTNKISKYIIKRYQEAVKKNRTAERKKLVKCFKQLLNK